MMVVWILVAFVILLVFIYVVALLGAAASDNGKPRKIGDYPAKKFFQMFKDAERSEGQCERLADILEKKVRPCPPPARVRPPPFGFDPEFQVEDVDGSLLSASGVLERYAPFLETVRQLGFPYPSEMDVSEYGTIAFPLAMQRLIAAATGLDDPHVVCTATNIAGGVVAVRNDGETAFTLGVQWSGAPVNGFTNGVLDQPSTYEVVVEGHSTVYIRPGTYTDFEDVYEFVGGMDKLAYQPLHHSGQIADYRLQLGQEVSSYGIEQLQAQLSDGERHALQYSQYTILGLAAYMAMYAFMVPIPYEDGAQLFPVRNGLMFVSVVYDRMLPNDYVVSEPSPKLYTECSALVVGPFSSAGAVKPSLDGFTGGSSVRFDAQTQFIYVFQIGGYVPVLRIDP